jgi:hypothetical protein
MGQPRTGWFSKVQQDINERGKSWKEIEKEELWEGRKTGDLSFISDQDKMENPTRTIRLHYF